MAAIRLAVVGIAAVCFTAGCSGSTAPSAAKVSSHLLTIADLPPGWTAEPVQGAGADDGPLCNSARPSHAQTERVAAFDGGSGDALLAENLHGFATSADARAAFTSEVSHATCTTYTTPDGAFLVKLGPLSWPTAGQQSRAWALSVTDQHTKVTTTGDVILVQDGQYDLAMIDRSETGPDTPLLRSTLATALTRLSH